MREREVAKPLFRERRKNQTASSQTFLNSHWAHENFQRPKGHYSQYSDKIISTQAHEI